MVRTQNIHTIYTKYTKFIQHSVKNVRKIYSETQNIYSLIYRIYTASLQPPSVYILYIYSRGGLGFVFKSRVYIQYCNAYIFQVF